MEKSFQPVLPGLLTASQRALQQNSSIRLSPVELIASCSALPRGSCYVQRNCKTFVNRGLRVKRQRILRIDRREVTMSVGADGVLTQDGFLVLFCHSS
jgi:hypothetical protein